MSKTTVKHSNSEYLLTLHTNKVDTPIKFDTGAIKSFLTLAALGGFNEADANEIRLQTYLSNRYKIANVNSASNVSMRTIMSCLSNVSIGNITLNKFYFVLNPVVSYRKALLGADFIQFCEFSHDINKDIKISRFDIMKYSRMKRLDNSNQVILNLDNMHSCKSYLYEIFVFINQQPYYYKYYMRSPLNAVHLCLIDNEIAYNSIEKGDYNNYNIKTRLLNYSSA